MYFGFGLTLNFPSEYVFKTRVFFRGMFSSLVKCPFKNVVGVGLNQKLGENFLRCNQWRTHFLQPSCCGIFPKENSFQICLNKTQDSVLRVAFFFKYWWTSRYCVYQVKGSAFSVCKHSHCSLSLEAWALSAWALIYKQSCFSLRRFIIRSSFCLSRLKH